MHVIPLSCHHRSGCRFCISITTYESIEANGIGILEKVYDIGWSLADILLLRPSSMQVSSLEIGPGDYLMELVRILGTVLGGSSKYLSLLAARVDECLQVRIRGSLSESESSNGIHAVEEIQENFEREESEAMFHGANTADEPGDFGVVEEFSTTDSFGQEHPLGHGYLGLNLLSLTDLAMEAQHFSLSLSIPD
jgi:hypothetical protein